MSSLQEKLTALRARGTERSFQPDTVESSARYESKKKSLLERLQKAPVIAALALLATYGPVKADGPASQDNVFTTLGESPLRASYEYVQENYRQQSPGARLAHLFNLRLEKNNVGNLDVSDEAINQAAIKQSQTVLEFLRGRGIANPTWSDIQAIQGDYTLANRLAAIEDSLGAKGTAAYTRVVFGEAPEFEKEAISELTYEQHTQLRNWKPFGRAEDVKDLDFAQLQNIFPSQDTPPRTPSTPETAPDSPTVTPLTEAEIQRAVDGDTSNTPPSSEDTLPANPDDVLLTPAEIDRASGKEATLPTGPSSELRGTGVLNFRGPDGEIIDPVAIPNSTAVEEIVEEVPTVPTPEVPDVSGRDIETANWLEKPFAALQNRVENLRASTRGAVPLAVLSLLGAGIYAARKGKNKTGATPTTVRSTPPRPFPSTPQQAATQTGAIDAYYQTRTQQQASSTQIRQQLKTPTKKVRGWRRVFTIFKR